MTLRELVVRRIRDEGPLPFAEYMDLALYHPRLGYYARAGRRSGRAGDFFTSVDSGAAFGALLARQFAEMWRLAGGAPALVEAGAGSGRLARDVLDHLAAACPDVYRTLRLTLVERSPAARAAQPATLGARAARLAGADAELPARVRGVVFANELLDALPVHPIVMTADGLGEVHVDRDGDRLVERLGPASAAVRDHVARFGIRLEPGWRAEVCPAAVAWVAAAARRLTRGFLVLIDYGHEARELYSPTHASGTLTCYRRHRAAVAGDNGAAAPWLAEPGACDITAHVDLTAVRAAAEEAGLQTLAVLDQTYFLLALADLGGRGESASDQAPVRQGATGEPVGHWRPRPAMVQRSPCRDAWPLDLGALRERLALKTLLVPGGLGSTHKVLIFGRGVGTPRLQGCAFGGRAT